jgi:MFS family permease
MNSEARRAFIATGLGWGLDGFTFTMFALALPAILVSFNMTVAQGGLITTTSIIASAFGGIVGGVLADRYGRAKVLAYIVLLFSVCTALTATSQNMYQLGFWRILEGFAYGAEWPVGAALLAEYATAKHRGRIMGFLQSAYATGWAGSTLTFYVVYSMFPDGTAWRFLFLVGILPALTIFWIRRSVKDRVVIKKAAESKNSFLMLFQGSTKRTTIIATIMVFGMNGMYYSVFAFLPLYLKTVQNLSLIGTATYVWITIIGSFLGYVFSGFLHDKLGRRPTFTIFILGAGATISLFIFLPIEGTMIAYAIGLLLGFFASGQAGGLGSFLSELFPTKMRATGKGFAYNVGRGISALGPAFIGIAASSLGLGNAILVIGLASCLIAVSMVWLLPETCGKEIVEESETLVQSLLNENPKSTVNIY